MNRLAFDVGTDAAPDFTNGIPMWGELPNQAVGEGFSPSGAPQEVTMIRAVAKFTLINPLESDLKGFSIITTICGCTITGQKDALHRTTIM